MWVWLVDCLIELRYTLVSLAWFMVHSGKETVKAYVRVDMQVS